MRRLERDRFKTYADDERTVFSSPKRNTARYYFLRTGRALSCKRFFSLACAHVNVQVPRANESGRVFKPIHSRDFFCTRPGQRNAISLQSRSRPGGVFSEPLLNNYWYTMVHNRAENCAPDILSGIIDGHVMVSDARGPGPRILRPTASFRTQMLVPAATDICIRGTRSFATIYEKK